MTKTFSGLKSYIFWRKKISNSINPAYIGNASALSTLSHRGILSEDDFPRTPKAPSVYAVRSAQSDLTSASGCSSKDVSLWRIIQAQQQQLNRIQDQIDRLIIAVGGLPPKREISTYDFANEKHDRMAISSAPASLAITAGPGRNITSVLLSDDEDDHDGGCLMSEEVAKLVRKYSTKLRE